MMSRIPKQMPKVKRRDNGKRSREHRAFVRAINICLACGSSHGYIVAAHVRKGAEDGGMGTKPSDKYCVPMCQVPCHNDQHRTGEVTFWGQLGIDPLDVACRLWTVSGDVEQGRRAVERARAKVAMKEMADG